MSPSTTFARILQELVETLPGALGAIFIDWEGEAVAEHSLIGTTRLRLVGAHWGIAYFQARSIITQRQLGGLKEMVLRFERQQIIIRRITDHYLVVLALQREGNLGRALHLLSRAETELQEEM